MAYIQKVVNKKGEVKYKIKVSCGYDLNNNQITHTMTYTPTATTPRKIEKEVQQQAVLFEQQCRNIKNDRKVKFAELADEWLELEEDKGQLKTATLELYKGFRDRTYKCIGHLMIQKIRRKDIQNLVNTLAYGYDGRKKLREKSQKNYICFVSDVFNYAVVNELIEDSPCHRLDFIASPKKARQFYSLEEEINLLSLLENRGAILTYRVCYLFLIMLGLRIGECLGIEWSDIDFAKGTVFIQRNSQYKNKSTGIYTTTPKTKSSIRCLTLPQEILDILPVLKAQQEDNRSKCGDLWINSDRLFCNDFGKPIHPNQPYNYLKRFCEREKIEFKALHSFRHSLVTNLIHSNVDVTTISNIVGHINGNVTLSVYAHEFKEATAFGCNVMSDLLNQQKKQAKTMSE
jgi:integrase